MTTDTDLIRENNQEGLQVGDFKVGDQVRHPLGGTGGLAGTVHSRWADGSNFWSVKWDGLGTSACTEADLELIDTPAPDVVAHPPHYVSHPSGIECIQITEHMGFNLGNAVKYIWRCDLKQDAIEDLKKARWYIEREIAKREAA